MFSLSIKREDDFSNLWDQRERDFKKMADTARVTTTKVSTKLRFSVNSNGEVQEMDGPAALDKLAALGIGSKSNPNVSPSNPLGLPIEACDDDSGGGGASAAGGIRSSTKAKSDVLLTRHNDTVSKAKARPHWDWDSVLT